MKRVRLKIRTPKVNTIPAWGFGAESLKVKNRLKLHLLDPVTGLRLGRWFYIKKNK
jgi:hypothetical protein